MCPFYRGAGLIEVSAKRKSTVFCNHAYKKLINHVSDLCILSIKLSS